MTQDRNFNRLLQARWDQNKFLCVGLDTDLGEIARMKIPGMPSDDVLAQMSYFNQHAVMATSRAAAPTRSRPKIASNSSASTTRAVT